MTAVLVLLGLLAVGAVTCTLVRAWPQLRFTRERQRVESERRLAEWRLRQAAHAAMRQLLEEARRPR
ncbi:MAG TPA: hypothetical protein VFH54_15235 [Mycobacteriales bacterium]|nr:hypothetical protein [Mycobacteriales bacterium]